MIIIVNCAEDGTCKRMFRTGLTDKRAIKSKVLRLYDDEAPLRVLSTMFRFRFVPDDARLLKCTRCDFTDLDNRFGPGGVECPNCFAGRPTVMVPDVSELEEV